MTKSRTCTACGKSYPATRAYFDACGKRGLRRVCKDCVRAEKAVGQQVLIVDYRANKLRVGHLRIDSVTAIPRNVTEGEDRRAYTYGDLKTLIAQYRGAGALVIETSESPALADYDDCLRFADYNDGLPFTTPKEVKTRG